MFIHQHLEATGFSPSFDEMKDGLDLRSKSGVHRLITALEERGFLRRRAHRARALEVVRLPAGNKSDINSNLNRALVDEEIHLDHQLVRLPMVGQIAAGNPIEALDDAQAWINIPSEMVTLGQHYAVNITGDSMSDAGILDGDTAIIQIGKSFNNGDIVVALIDDREVTLKKIRRRGNSIALEPCNPAYETRIFGADRVKIQGSLVGLLRTYHKK